MKFKFKRLLLALFIPYTFLLATMLIKTDYEIISPGGITNVESFITLADAKKEAGNFNSIYVLSFEKASVFQKFVANFSKKNDVIAIHDYYKHLSSSDMRLMGAISKQSSVENSIILSYLEAQKKNNAINIEYFLEGVKVYFTLKEVTNLKIDDLIYQVNDINYLHPDFIHAVTNLKVGDKLQIIRNKKELSIDITNHEINQKMQLYKKYFINEENIFPKFHVNSNNSGGPSGGLLQALSLYNRLSDFDYTRGLKIVGTGTINVEGKVGSIGGVEQKIFTAQMNDADLFFVPKDNYSDALKAYQSIKNPSFKLVVVETLSEALRYLENDQNFI